MIIKLNSKFKQKNIIFTFSAAAAVFGLLCSYIGILAIPFAAAYFASLFAFSYPKNYGALIYAAIAAAVCVISAFNGVLPLFSALISVALGLVIALAYVLGRTKAEAVCAACAAVVLLILFCIWLIGAVKTGAYDIASIRDYYIDCLSEIKSTTANDLNVFFKDSLNYSEEELASTASLFDTYFENIKLLLPSLLVALSLLVCGVAFKLFSLSVYKYSADTSYILSWRFLTSSVFVFFYIALAFINIFASEISVFTLAAINLYSIFNFIYAYAGYNFAVALLAQKMRPAFARLIVISALLLISAAMQILAVLGVIFTLAANKARKNPTAPMGDNNESEGDNEKQ